LVVNDIPTRRVQSDEQQKEACKKIAKKQV